MLNQLIQTARTRAGEKRFRLTALALGSAGFFTVLGWSAAVAFERHTQPVPLAATQRTEQADTPSLGDRPAPSFEMNAAVRRYEEVGVAPKPSADRAQPAVVSPQPTRADAQTAQPPAQPAASPGVKFDRLGKVIMVNGTPWTGEVFDHRPIRPVRTRTMKTTAYSPDEKSCGKWADGITASGKSVWMNGGRLVAADKSIPYGTILTIPGYNDDKPVQVWDRGGKIKGNRLDLLYPTHEIALQWGVQDLPVVFWEFVESD